MKKLLLSTMLMFSVAFVFAQTAFTPGNLVVYRYGDGTYKDAGEYPASSEQLPTFLDEYTKAGVLVQSIPLPTTTIGDQRALTGIGTATQEGGLVRSTNGLFLTLMGYETPVGSTTVNDGPRVVARFSIDGTVNTASATPHRQKGVSPVANDISTARMAVTSDGTGFWFVGTSAGKVRYMPFEFNKGLAIPDMENAVLLGGGGSNFAVDILADKVYYSTTNALNNFTGPLPTTVGSPAVGNSVPGNAFQFVLLDTDSDDEPDLMYAAQEINNGTGETRIAKYANVLVSGTKTWVTKGSFYSATINVHTKFLTVEVVAGIAKIYFASHGTATATSDPGTAVASTIYKIENDLMVDLDNSLTPVLIATAPAKTSFRGIAFAPEDILLPVKLSSFTGKSNGLNGVNLNWSTTSEKNNSHFEVLHAINGKDFSLIGTVSGNNNSERLINYSYTDVKPTLGPNYYQLNQVDFDGKSEKSKIISVENSLANSELSISVDQNQITLFVGSNEATTAKLVISDMSGKVVVTKTLQLTAGSNSTKLDASNLPTGVYTASLITEATTQTKKFVK